ncbi:MAG: hypothetical protein OEX07_02400 [Gammaproteobacteria bacterium]|nr:hypothetical protein [Gammaproteobacteria bacterium]
MFIRFFGIILAVIVGMFIYDNYINKSEVKEMVSSIVENEKVINKSQSINQEFEQFKKQRLQEFEDFKNAK